MKTIKTQSRRRFFQTSLCATLIALLYGSVCAQQTALDRYVAKPDPAYSWKLVNTTQGEGYKALVLELTSQHWRTETDLDRPIRKHWLTIVKSDKPSMHKALL